jgi:hypothetical protein
MTTDKSAFVTFIASCLVALCSLTSFAQKTDEERLRVARVAIEKYQDCAIGREVLEEISEARRRTDRFVIYYMARSYECSETLSDLQGAIKWYEEYDQLVPGNAEIVNKLIALRVKTGNKRNDETQKAKEREALSNDISGLWQPDDGGDVFRITQTGTSVVVVFQKVALGESNNFNWHKGSVKFEGIRQGKLIQGKYFLHLNRYGDASNCAEEFQAASLDAVLEVSDDGKTIEGLFGKYDVDVQTIYYPLQYICKRQVDQYAKKMTWRRKDKNE